MLRADVRWWDDLTIPDKIDGVKLYRWLAAVMPHELAHDYIISTDGSGAKDGIGAAAAVIQRVDFVDDADNRGVVDVDAYICGNCGESVQRNELGAFINGVRIALKDAMSKNDELDTLDKVQGIDRIRVIWYTDRINLAGSFLFRENGNPVFSRKSDRDLWAQWAYFAKHVCVTPVCLPRNEEQAQKLCDAICTVTRNAMKSVAEFVTASDARIEFKNKSQTSIK